MDFADLKNILITELSEQKKQLFLWSPIFLAIGVGIYFSLPIEPPLIIGSFTVIIFVLPLLFMREEGKRAIAILRLLWHLS